MKNKNQRMKNYSLPRAGISLSEIFTKIKIKARKLGED